jgi:hypothetical protein
MTGVIDRVLVALNAHDLEGFIACYAEDATIENGYDRVAARGHEELRTMYGAMFEAYPDISVEPGWRTQVGDFVVQAESVTGRRGHEQHVAVYQVENDLIVRERLFA